MFKTQNLTEVKCWI